jgi:hypothetical protein
VLQPCRRTIVARGEDPLVSDEHRSYLVPEAGGSPGHNGGNLHEVLVQMRPVEERHQPTILLEVKNVTQNIRERSRP